eukprot:EC721019.1.p2 GENE.EC721019.1~~EC721019.1.p2  ORF type:complete len:119 (+),score=12.60 EC721019.1:34-390(+)
MAVLSPKSTGLLSTAIAVVLLSVIQLLSPILASSEKLTIVGGFLCALLFLFILFAIGNFENLVGLPTRWPEVAMSLLIATIVASTVHRVCVTTCVLFSAGLLAYAHFGMRHQRTNRVR